MDSRQLARGDIQGGLVQLTWAQTAQFEALLRRFGLFLAVGDNTPEKRRCCLRG
jgi:hypothetical protein